jgi:oxygen-dependent protoporphyrinogen oxidase
MTKVAIVGGGLTGLVAARYARSQGDAVTVLEAERRTGGLVVTVREGGFVIEGGPDGWLASRPEPSELCEELGIAGELITQKTRRVLAPNRDGMVALKPGRAAALLGIETSEAGAAGGFFSLRRGLGSLVEMLDAELGDAIERETRVVALERSGAAWRIHTTRGTREADHVVLAVPARVAADLLRPLDAGASRLLERWPHASTATMSLAFRRADVSHRLDSAGLVVPRESSRALVACTFVSSKFPFRAPEGTVLLRAHAGRYGPGDLLERDDDELISAVLEELAPLLGIRGDPLLWRVFRWPRSLPRREGEWTELARRVRARSRELGLALAGAGYDGSGIPDCLASARSAVGAVRGRVPA